MKDAAWLEKMRDQDRRISEVFKREQVRLRARIAKRIRCVGF